MVAGPAAAHAIVPATTFRDERLLEVFNAAYSDYFVPIHLDLAAWRAMVRRFDIDLEASRAAGDGGGVALLALRGARGWVAGMGVAPGRRRGGLGRALMVSLIEQARRRAVREIVLEVLEQNTPAIALYESLGFRRFRMLDVWLLEAPLPAGPAREIDAAAAMAWIAGRRAAPEPWQRADESVRRFASLETPLRGLEVRERGERIGAAVGLATPARASLLQAAVDGDHPFEAARALLAGARAWGPALRFLNVPSHDPLAQALHEAGATLEARQLEMALGFDEA